VVNRYPLSKSKTDKELTEIRKGTEERQRDRKDPRRIISVTKEAPVVFAFAHVHQVNVAESSEPQYDSQTICRGSD